MVFVSPAGGGRVVGNPAGVLVKILCMNGNLEVS